VTAGGDRFAELAEPLLATTGVTRSTMMGLPCLRRDGVFFAAWDRGTEALLIKLSRTRVDELLGSGAAQPFARRAAVPAMGSGAPAAGAELARVARRGAAVRRRPGSRAPTRRNPVDLHEGARVDDLAGFPDPYTVSR
jgi:hypothetical protein